MTNKEIKELLKLVSELDLKEVNIKNKEFQIKIRTDKDQPIQMVSGAAPVMAQTTPVVSSAAAPVSASASAAQESSAEEGGNYIEIKSPMVGTFYRSSSPDKPPFVQVGDTIGKGDVVCIIEAMKLFNEIESEISGKIVKVLIDDSTPVEYDQVLFLVEPA